MNILLDETKLKAVKVFDGNADIDFSTIERISYLFSDYDSDNYTQPSICILLERSSLYIGAILAAWKAGFYVVPLNTAWPLEKNLDIMKRINPTLVLIEDSFDISDISLHILKRSILLKKIADFESNKIVLRPLKAHDIAYIIFTSGSTGEPKGVTIAVSSYRAYIDWTKHYFSRYRDIKKLLLTSELTFDITMGDIAFSLAFGTDIGVARQHTNIPSILAMIMKYNVDLLYSVPTTHSALLNFAKQKKGADISSLRLVISGGDRFNWQMVRDYLELVHNVHFYNVYGPTEVTINCFSIRLDDKVDELASKNKPVPIGECFNTLDYVLLDGDSTSLVEGELCVVGNQVMLGYVFDPDKTKEVLVSDPRVTSINRKIYRTGDLVYLDEGLVYLNGRLDDLVKIKGYRVHPDETAKALGFINGIDTSAVVAIECDDDAKLIAFIKFNKNVTLPIDHINNLLIEKLATPSIPAKYIIIEEFPLNQSGKIDKKALKDYFK